MGEGRECRFLFCFFLFWERLVGGRGSIVFFCLFEFCWYKSIAWGERNPGMRWPYYLAEMNFGHHSLHININIDKSPSPDFLSFSFVSTCSAAMGHSSCPWFATQNYGSSVASNHLENNIKTKHSCWSFWHIQALNSAEWAAYLFTIKGKAKVKQQ